MAKKLTARKLTARDPIDLDTAVSDSHSTIPAADRPEKSSTFSQDRVTALAKRQMDLLATMETKVLRDEKPGAIHDLRVASRRLQQILDLLYPKPRTAKMRKIRRTVRRARRSLSVVRNTDVLLKKAKQHLDRKRVTYQAVWISFRDYLQQQRETQIRKAGRKLGRLNLTDSYVHIKEALMALEETDIPRPAKAGPKSSRRAASKPASKPAIVARFSGQQSEQNGLASAPPQESRQPELGALLTQSLLQSWENLNEQFAQSKKQPDAKTIHAVRIAGKKLRYLIEVMQALQVEGSEPALAWLRHLQKHLGDWHDLEVMEQTMIEMLARPKFLAHHLELSVETEKLILRNRKTKDEYQDRFFEMVEQKADWERLGAWIHSFAGWPIEPNDSMLVQQPVESPTEPSETPAG